MLRRFEKPVVIALALCWALGFSYQVGLSSQYQEHRKQIEASYKARYGIDHQDRPNETGSLRDRPARPQAENGSHQSAEVTFVGLKLGDGLLVIVTVLLVLATRDLVIGASNATRKQLRAYVSVQPRGIKDFHPDDRVLGH